MAPTRSDESEQAPEHAKVDCVANQPLSGVSGAVWRASVEGLLALRNAKACFGRTPDLPLATLVGPLPAESRPSHNGSDHPLWQRSWRAERAPIRRRRPVASENPTLCEFSCKIQKSVLYKSHSPEMNPPVGRPKMSGKRRLRHFAYSLRHDQISYLD